MIYAGIDPSFNSTGIVLLNTNTNEYKYYGFTTKKKLVHNGIIHYIKFDNHLEQYLFMIKEIKQILIKHKVDKVYIEGYSYNSQSNTQQKVYGFGEMLRLLFYSLQIPYIQLAPTRVKSKATGNGHADKNLMAKFFYDDVDIKDFAFKDIMFTKSNNIIPPFGDIIDASYMLKVGMSEDGDISGK